MFIYLGFFFILTFAFLLLSGDITKVIVSLQKPILILIPLISILFGTMYYYSSREFIELLLAQPLSRTAVFTGMYLGLAVSLTFSLVAGVSIPMIMYRVLESPELPTFITMINMASVLTIIFSLIAFLIAMRMEDKIRGFGWAIFTWLFFAIIYDGIVLLILLTFREYPLEKLSIGLIVTNPIDLARILITMKLDISAMFGYTGAVLQKFLGSSMGVVLIISSLTVWVGLPILFIRRLAARKDF